ncbi:four-carbon acid sugar kinase family protein [Neorhizobium sp. DAR64860/K0K1]|uniref:four-carbon acid sugar kinase family protein n=1 Tax=Neorhizobium sp. DAR64860/K0K1 TaxID=3421955 RepID=UPI003D284562
MSRLLLSFYGDDFTGSTDVMEALASNGIATVLFLGRPDGDMLERFKDCRALGIAGSSRSETPEWMEAHLTPALAWLQNQHAEICHYKVCSTFDSSPTIGNIGKAIEIGKRLFNQPCVPVVVGAPQLKRYTAFGHLFAAYQGKVYRIDRHPVMSRHPVTPMDEADLTLHLGKQTSLPIRLADLATLTAAGSDALVDAQRYEAPSICILDVEGDATQLAAGRQLLRQKAATDGLFVAGSSGVEYAVINAWRNEGVIGEKTEFPSPGPVDRIAVVSGSVSPTTERQIRTAASEGFDTVGVDPLALLGEEGDRVVESAVARGISSLSAGRSVVLNTALGPSADRGGEIDRVPGARHCLGRSLGVILRRLVEQEGLKRAVIAGGDTSSHALLELRIEALTTLLPLPQTPGSPLCTAHGNYRPTNGLQIALKGGQVGTDSYFAQIRDGRSS